MALLAGVLAVVLGAPVASAPAQVQPSWPQFGYGANHQGFNPSEDRLSPVNVSALVKKWSYPTGASVDSAPAVVDGVAYFGSTNNNQVCALNAADGTKRWCRNTGLRMGAPAYAGGVLYVPSYFGQVIALRASDGSVLWRFTAGDFIEFSTTAVVDGVVYFGSDDYYLYAVNARTGRLKWRFNTGYMEWGAPTVAHGIVYAAGDNNTLWALDTRDGSVRWIHHFGCCVSPGAKPAVANGVLYLGAHPGIVAFNAVTGAELWDRSIDSPWTSSPVVVDGSVFLGASNGSLYAFGLR